MIAPRVKVLFWTLAGCAVAACNHAKTRLDIAGANIWAGVRRHAREFRPSDGLTPLPAPPGVAYVAGRIEPCYADLASWPPSAALLALPDLSLRFAKLCRHSRQPGTAYDLSYDEATRTFYFDCPQCRTLGKHLGTLWKQPFPSRQKHQKEKAWRAEFHEAL